MPSAGFKLMIPAIEQPEGLCFRLHGHHDRHTAFKEGKKVKVTLVQALRLCTGCGWVGEWV